MNHNSLYMYIHMHANRAIWMKNKITIIAQDAFRAIPGLISCTGVTG